MKLLMMGIAGLFCLSGCGADIIVADGGGGSPGAGAGTTTTNAGAFPSLGGASNGGGSGGDNIPADCSVSPESYEAYSSLDELKALLVGRWLRCSGPPIQGEDIGLEFTDDGKIYPLTTDSSQQVVRRTGVDYEKTWSYIPPGGEDPISHEPSVNGLIVLGGVFTSVPDFTANPRQLRILFSPSYSKYVPLLP